MKKFVPVIVLLAFIQLGCDPVSKCPEAEDWGNFELLETSKQLLTGVDTNSGAVFLDSTGKEIHYNIYRNERLVLRNYNCDENENGIIDSGEPLVYEAYFEANNIGYYSSDYQEIHLSLIVQYPANVDPITMENFEDGLSDFMSIGIANQPTFTWTVDKRKGGAPVPEYLVHFAEEITLNGKLFTNVYWDDKYLSNGVSRYIIYFNKAFGIVGIRNTFNGYLLSFDHFE